MAKYKLCNFYGSKTYEKDHPSGCEWLDFIDGIAICKNPKKVGVEKINHNPLEE